MWLPLTSFCPPLRTCLVSHSGDYHINRWVLRWAQLWLLKWYRPLLSLSMACAYWKSCCHREVCQKILCSSFLFFSNSVPVWASLLKIVGATFQGMLSSWLIACQSTYLIRSFWERFVPCYWREIISLGQKPMFSRCYRELFTGSASRYKYYHLG